MNVNWQNLVTTIRQGQQAFDGGGFGQTIDTGSLTFYDHPISDLSQGNVTDAKLNEDVFIIGASQWGQNDVVAE